jgi:photosystem II stability/assembly factor-like uncharacterized protein
MIARTAWEQPLPRGIGELPSAGTTDELLCTSALVGWLATFGSGHNLWRTHDGGSTWIPVTDLVRASVPVLEIGFYGSAGRVRFGDGSEWLTGDAGVTWSAVDWAAKMFVDAPCELFRMQDGNRFVLDASHEWRFCYGHAGGGNVSKILLYSDDGAQSWSLISWGTWGPYFIERPESVGSLSGGGIVTDLLFTTATEGWMGTGGHIGGLHRTLDGGRTWRRIDLGTSPTVSPTSIRFESPLTGMVTFWDGRTWITQDGGATWTELPPTPTPAAR